MDPDSWKVSECSKTDTLAFFHSRLLEQTARSGVTVEEFNYVASIFASHAMTSRRELQSQPIPSDLYELFDHFILNKETAKDEELLVHAGAQSLILVGFFKGQMDRRHNISWFVQMGGGFFLQASSITKSNRRQDLYRNMGNHFPIWSETCWRMSRAMHDSRYLIRPNTQLN